MPCLLAGLPDAVLCPCHYSSGRHHGQSCQAAPGLWENRENPEISEHPEMMIGRIESHMVGERVTSAEINKIPASSGLL